MEGQFECREKGCLAILPYSKAIERLNVGEILTAEVMERLKKWYEDLTWDSYEPSPTMQSDLNAIGKYIMIMEEL
jgi:hypothetical protein